MNTPPFFGMRNTLLYALPISLANLKANRTMALQQFQGTTGVIKNVPGRAPNGKMYPKLNQK